MCRNTELNFFEHKIFEVISVHLLLFSLGLLRSFFEKGTLCQINLKSAWLKC